MFFFSRGLLKPFLAFSCVVFLVGASKPIRSKKPRRPDTVLYQIKQNATAAQLAALEQVLIQYGLRTSKKLANGKIHFAKITRAQARDVRDVIDEEQVAAQLLASGAVDYAEIDELVAPSALPNDPALGSQWHHRVIDSEGAWNQTVGSTSVLAAVCDTGVESSHPDLRDNLALPGFNSVDDSTNSEPISSHGTFVAGLLGAVGNNGLGISGVAWDIKILPIRISNRSDGLAFNSDMVECITHAANQGAKVVNLSYSSSMISSINTAAQVLREKGGLLFMAAGNDGSLAPYADYPAFIMVGGTTSSDTRASWSNYGDAIDLVAPGASVYSTTTGGSYRSGSGTSFATPIAAGVAALVYSVNPELTPSQVEQILFSTADDIGDVGEDSIFGHGRVNAHAAVMLAAQTDAEVTPNRAPTAVASANVTSGVGPLSVAFRGASSYDSDGTIVGYRWSFGDGATSTAVSPSYVYQSVGTYTASLTVTDNDGATHSTALKITVQEASNTGDVVDPTTKPTRGKGSTGGSGRKK